MHRGFRVFVAVAAVAVASASLVIRADVPSSQASEIQLQLGDLLSSEGRFLEALDAYRLALKVAPPDGVRRPRVGVQRHRLGIGRVAAVKDFGFLTRQIELGDAKRRHDHADARPPDIVGRRDFERQSVGVERFEKPALGRQKIAELELDFSRL